LQLWKQHSHYQFDHFFLEDDRATREHDNRSCPDHRRCPDHRGDDNGGCNLPDPGSGQYRARRLLQWAGLDPNGGWRDRVRVHE
jgi:hypothetical protein